MDTIYTSIADNNLDTLRILLNGVDNVILHNALLYAISHKKLDIVKYVISLGVEIKTSKSIYNDELYTAVCTGYMPIIKYLVSCGCEVQIKHITHTQKIYNISLYRYLVSVYMTYKNDISEVAEKLFTTVFEHQIINIRMFDFFECVISHGADIKQYNYGLLILGIEYQQMWVIQLFFVGQSPPQHILQEGLIYAVYTGNMEILKYLIHHGAKVDIPGLVNRDEDVDDSNKATPMDIAKQRGKQNIIAYFEECQYVSL